MKKTCIKRAFGVVSMILAVWALIASCARGDRNYLTVRAFYQEPRDSLDVVFLGASEVSTDVSSAYAYELSGLTSYQFGIDSNLPSVYLSQLQDILSRQKPQLIVVEVNGFLIGPGNDLYEEAMLRTYLDPTPLTRHKWETLSRLHLQGDYYTYIMPFFNSHAQWEHPRALFTNILSLQEIRARGYSLFKGYLTKPERMAADGPSLLPSAEEKLPLSSDEVCRLLQEFTCYCADNDLPVVFARFPHHLSEKREANAYRRFLSLKEQLAEEGFHVLDLQELQDEIGLQDEDYYNASHLNLYGQEKLTAYLIDLFREEYGVTPHTLAASERENWDNCVAYYKQIHRMAKENMDFETRFILEETPIVHRLRRGMTEAGA